jgi:hypothetical protein
MELTYFHCRRDRDGDAMLLLVASALADFRIEASIILHLHALSCSVHCVYHGGRVIVLFHVREPLCVFHNHKGSSGHLYEKTELF